MEPQLLSVDVPIPQYRMVQTNGGGMDWVRALTDDTLRYEADLADEAIRDALIKLGWTPPPTHDKSLAADVVSDIAELVSESLSDLYRRELNEFYYDIHGTQTGSLVADVTKVNGREFVVSFFEDDGEEYWKSFAFRVRDVTRG